MPEAAIPLFALSKVHRNALMTALTRSGVLVIGARRFDDAQERYLEAGAGGAIVDLRDDGHAGLAAIRSLASHTRVLAIVPGRDVKWITAAIDAGASHYLTSPFPQVELAQAVRLIGGEQRELPIEPRSAALLDAVGAGLAIDRQLRVGGASVLLIAATRFEAVNAAFGRDIGDELVGIVGQRIAAAARDIDPMTLVARLAGAEFAVMVPAGRGMTLAHEICRRIDRPFMVAGQFVTVGCRIGVADSAVGEDAAALLRRASSALAEARLSETSPVAAIGTTDMPDTLFDATLETDLRRALAADEIEIMFQPQIETSSRRIVGVEALARWRHPVHGELAASTLFAVAARSDYLATLSRHIQQRALQMAAAWPASLAPLRLAVNVTAADVAQPGFARDLLARIATSGFGVERLTVEITESGLIDNLESAAAAFATLRAGGVRIAIDDFGTGYSSLAWLKALPLDYLKIDKGLAQDIAGSLRDRVVVRGVIDMARSLGLAVVAEGVETEAQLELLAGEGCQYWQGYLCSGAVDAIALARLLA